MGGAGKEGGEKGVSKNNDCIDEQYNSLPTLY